MALAARLTRYRAVAAYDGTAYYGYQRQGGGTPTVQGAIETAIAQVTGAPVTVSAAGRTDTGVHAAGQVIAFDVAWKHAPEALWRAVNANLPHDIALISLSMADPMFHPRYDARSRMYEYALYVAPARQPLLDRYAWHVPVREPLDVNAMQAAAGVLVGTHDFAAFGQPPQGENTVREVMRSDIDVLLGARPGEQVIRYTVEANAFLYRMVRRLVGALARVGTGALTTGAFEEAFRAADGAWPNQTAPACGLCLIKVTY